MKIKLNQDDQMWFYDFMHTRLEKYGVVERREIKWGCQLKLSGGQFVNLYYSLTCVVNGKNPNRVLRYVKKRVAEFEWAWRTYAQTERLIQTAK